MDINTNDNAQGHTEAGTGGQDASVDTQEGIVSSEGSQGNGGNDGGGVSESEQGGDAPQDGDTAQTDNSGEQGGKESPWFQGMPEELHEHLDGFESLEDAMSALKRGRDYQPATDIEQIDIKFAEGAKVDETMTDSFKQFCVEKGLTPQQAQDLSDWQFNEVMERQTKALEEGNKVLRDNWKNDYDTNREAALVTLSTLDRHLDGRVSTGLKELGCLEDPTVIETLHLISTLVSEDSLGGSAPGSGGETPVEAQDHFKDKGFK